MNLQWTEAKRQRLSKPIKTAGGCECYFLHLTPTTGVKIFYSRENRDYAYAAQRKAARHGIGVPVGQRFVIRSLKIPTKIRDYWEASGYTDELGYDQDSTIYYGYVTIVAKKVGRFNWDAHYKLIEALYIIGLDGAEDLHEDNVGRYRGKLICLDFGKISTPNSE